LRAVGVGKALNVRSNGAPRWNAHIRLAAQKAKGTLARPLVGWKSSYFFFFLAAFLVAFFLVAMVLFSLPFVMEYCDSNFHRNLLVV
jgi:hypothetical protein